MLQQTNKINEKLNRLTLRDELQTLTRRTLALELALMGASKECAMNSYGDALTQLAHDIALDLEALEQKLENYFNSLQEESVEDKD